jgi:hypothetical protein
VWGHPHVVICSLLQKLWHSLIKLSAHAVKITCASQTKLSQQKFNFPHQNITPN